MTEEFEGKKCRIEHDWIKDFFVMLALIFLFLIIHMTEEPDDYFLFVVSYINGLLILFGVTIGFLDKFEGLIMTLCSCALSFLNTSGDLWMNGDWLTYLILFIRGAVITAMSFAIGNVVGDWGRMSYDYYMCRRSKGV